ncbi:hypothetical protein ACFYY2_05815 [Streptomyces sp. NPDC001822]|uniref:hypothetical protein n=1 Tax=Streptomyces sp. NPDC001822 TaxID=3364614 RepID=UPI0036BBC87C
MTEVLTAAYRKTAAAKSAKVHMTVTAPAAGGGTMEMDGKRWMTMDLGAIAKASGNAAAQRQRTRGLEGMNQDPAQQPALLLESPNLKRVGAEKIGGVATQQGCGAPRRRRGARLPWAVRQAPKPLALGEPGRICSGWPRSRTLHKKPKTAGRRRALARGTVTEGSARSDDLRR